MCMVLWALLPEINDDDDDDDDFSKFHLASDLFCLKRCILWNIFCLYDVIKTQSAFFIMFI